MTPLPTQDAAVTAEEAKTMQDTPELPPLPEPQTLVTEADVGDRAYTAWQMREYARAAIREYATRLAAAPKGWMPIETAPKDKALLLWFPESEVWAAGPWRGQWASQPGEWSIHAPYAVDGKGVCFTGLSQPTHWQWLEPLTPAPDAAPAASSPEVAAMLVPLSDDRKSVFIDGIGEVPLAYPASSPEVADERAAMFDAFGSPRKRYVRLTVDGSHCIDRPENLADNIGDMAPGEYTTADIFLSEREFNDLPEFDGF